MTYSIPLVDNTFRWKKQYNFTLSSTWCAFVTTEVWLEQRNWVLCVYYRKNLWGKNFCKLPEKYLICSCDDEAYCIACVIQALSATPLCACIDIYTTIQCRFSQCAHSNMSCEKVQYIKTAKACCYLNTPLISQIIKLHTGTSVVVINMCNGRFVWWEKEQQQSESNFRWFFTVWISGYNL